jgi:hypothetical protein
MKDVHLAHLSGSAFLFSHEMKTSLLRLQQKRGSLFTKAT